MAVTSVLKGAKGGWLHEQYVSIQWSSSLAPHTKKNDHRAARIRERPTDTVITGILLTVSGQNAGAEAKCLRC